MISISVCMIVKNEEKVLKRCLDSLEGLYDELIIVDTGSTDSTRSIASEYTDKIYDFEWVDDFSEARNFSFSKATCDYIYCPDADEILDEENRAKFKMLKQVMIPEVEIVQMKYVNQLENGSVYNFDSEYRPKLYKRLRSFTFIDPVHETVRLDPVVFESDIEIIHKPESVHAGRDIRIFEKVLKEGNILSERLTRMYVLELLTSGTKEEIATAAGYFSKVIEAYPDNAPILKLATIILSKNAQLKENASDLLKYASYSMTGELSSEIATIVGEFFFNKKDYKEAESWFTNARDYCEAELSLKYKIDIPTARLKEMSRGDRV